MASNMRPVEKECAGCHGSFIAEGGVAKIGKVGGRDAYVVNYASHCYECATRLWMRPKKKS